MAHYPRQHRKHTVNYIWDAVVPEFSRYNKAKLSKPLGKTLFTKLSDFFTPSFTPSSPGSEFSSDQTGDYALQIVYNFPSVAPFDQIPVPGFWYIQRPSNVRILYRYNATTTTGPNAPVYPTTREQRRSSEHAWYISIEVAFAIAATDFLPGGSRYSRDYRAHYNIDDTSLSGPPTSGGYNRDGCPLPTLQCTGRGDQYRQNSTTRTISDATVMVNHTTSAGTPSAEVIAFVDAVFTTTLAEAEAMTLRADWRSAALPYAMAADVPNYSWITSGGSPSGAVKVGSPHC